MRVGCGEKKLKAYFFIWAGPWAVRQPEPAKKPERVKSDRLRNTAHITGENEETSYSSLVQYIFKALIRFIRIRILKFEYRSGS